MIAKETGAHRVTVRPCLSAHTHTSACGHVAKVY